MAKFPKYVVLFLLFHGWIFFAIGAFAIGGKVDYIFHWKDIQWKVTSINTSRSDEWTTMYSQNFSYSTPSWSIKNWKSSGSSSWNSYKQWDSIELIYSKDKDTAIMKWFFELYWLGLFGLVWLLELLLVIYLIMRYFAHKRLKEELISTWKLLQTEIISIDKSAFRYNNKYSYIIRAQSVNENDGKIYVFKSEHLFFKPSFEEWEKISVYVKPMNFKKYYMDIRELESKYVEA